MITGTAGLQIRVLGPPGVEWAGQSLSIPRRRARALLYRLAAGLVPVARDELCFLFWPDVPDSTARRNLSHLLTHLRLALPAPDSLLLSADRVGLDAQCVWSDAVAFQRACGRVPYERRSNAALQGAIDLYRGPFAAGFSLGQCPEFEGWLLLERQRQEWVYLQALAVLVDRYAAHGKPRAAIALARRYLACDELAEEMHCRLMDLYDAVHDRHAAHQQFERLTVVLERELGASPLPESRAADQAILAGRPALPGAEHSTAAAPPLRLPAHGRRACSQGVATRLVRSRADRQRRCWQYPSHGSLSGALSRGKEVLALLRRSACPPSHPSPTRMQPARRVARERSKTMSLSFYTQPHQMTFVDPLGNVTNAWALAPLTSYQVFFVIQNDGLVLEQNVQVEVTHSAFGIGLPGGTSCIVQPAPVDVPPKGPGGNGLATVVFGFNTPEAGHGCLYASILPSGPGLPQNTDIANVPAGATSTLSFLVFNTLAAPRAMTLKLSEVEALPAGGYGPPAPPWNPQIVPPPDILTDHPSAMEWTLHMPSNTCRSAGLRVTVPPVAALAHTFTVDGFDGALFINSIQRTLTPVPAAQWVPPDPYVVGTYQSPDVLLYTPAGIEVPVGGGPGFWDTSLIAGVDHGFAARVHNASTSAAIHVEVHFWEFWGGVGAAGTLLSVETVSVPALGEAIVHSAVPFRSAPFGQHKCAVVSIYDALAGTCANAWTAADVPDPAADWAHSCSAWRNCTSRLIQLIEPWHILLQPTFPGKKLPPVDIDVVAFHVPREWAKQETARAMRADLAKRGVPKQMPLFLVPDLREALRPMPLKAMDLRFDTQAEVEPVEPRAMVADPAAAAGFRIKPLDRRQYAPVDIVGRVPEGAKEGDVLLVEVTAHYPESGEAPARALRYMEILHIGKK